MVPHRSVSVSLARGRTLSGLCRARVGESADRISIRSIVWMRSGHASSLSQIVVPLARPWTGLGPWLLHCLLSWDAAGSRSIR